MKTTELSSPISGVLLPLTSVPDQVFSSGMLGSGFAIDPTEPNLFSPIDGKVIQLHKSHHALTIESKTGSQILIHIGIDTVKLRGNGFSPKVKEGDSVERGQLLVDIDLDFIAQKNIPLTTVVINLDQDKIQDELTLISDKDIISSNDIIALIEEKTTDKKEKQLNSLEESFSNTYQILFPNGMHARPAARISEFAKKSHHQISFTLGEKTASATSVVSLLSLGLENATKPTIKTVGENPKVITAKLIGLLDNILEDELKTKRDESTKPEIISESKNPNHLNGVSASSGLAIGKAVLAKAPSFDFDENSSETNKEVERFETTLKGIDSDLADLEKDLLKNKENTAKAAIFAAHREILNDAEMIEDTIKLIQTGKTAEFSIDNILENKAKGLEALKNELIAARANDLRDIKNRILASLLNIETGQSELKENSIIIAEDLTPSDIIQFDQNKVIGFCTILGGSTSHVAILARSMGIPAVAGIDKKVLSLQDGQDVILHAHEGYLEINPTQQDIESAVLTQNKLKQELDEALKETMSIATTKDNHRIHVVSNIGSLSDTKKAVELGAEGVGLLRTEFIFLDKHEAPTEEEQLNIYQDITNELKGNPLVIRTLDIGGDKQLPYLSMPEEENPFLGVRGIRLCLKHPEIFREQLRAILRVKSKEPLNIMFPMVGHISELQEAKAILEEERVKLDAKKPNIGIMIEVPSAALMAEEFAKEVDFFSVGTNDLTQYTLAMDRGHNELASKVDGLNPAVLKLISITCKAAQKYNCWVGVCGGVASEVKAVPVLIGLGVTELSLSMPAIPLVKAAVRKLNKKSCTELAESFINAKDAAEVRSIVSQNWPELN